MKKINYEIALNEPPQTDKVNGEDLKDIYCSTWPIAVTILDQVCEMIKNPILRGIVSLALGILDRIHSQICKP